MYSQHYHWEIFHIVLWVSVISQLNKTSAVCLMFMQASIRSLNFHFAIAVLTKGMQGKYAHMDTHTVGSDKSQKFLTSNVQIRSEGQ